MPLNITNDPSLNTRLYFSKSKTTQADDGSWSITLRKPSTRETFFRRVRNAITFGAWTPFVSNRKDWKAFRRAVTLERFSQLPRNDDPTSNEEATRTKLMKSIATAFSTYSTTQRLTASKASEIMNLIKRDMASDRPDSALKEAPAGGPTKLSQGLIARGLHTLDQRQHGREQNRNVEAVDTELSSLSTELDNVALGPEVEQDFSYPEDIDNAPERLALTEDAKHLADLQSHRTALVSKIAETQKILKLGHGFSAEVLNSGMRALQAQASADADKKLIFPGSESWPGEPVHMLGLHDHPTAIGDYIREVAAKLSSNDDVRAQLSQPAGTSSIVAIPLSLGGGRSLTHENHSVLLALDLKDRRVLYLDAKGESPRAAERHYSNTQGMQLALQDLGRSVFGAQWVPETGIAMLSNAKQQGANDCVAFTHDFTRRLLEGQTVADIDRTMSEVERDGRSPAHEDGQQPASPEALGIRARMAREISDHVLRPEIEAFKQKVADWRSSAQLETGAVTNSSGGQV
jgi:hypothetical protein